MMRNKVCDNNVMLTITTVAIVFLVILGSMKIVNADRAVDYEKSFMSIEICSGDTLTSIAQQYAISEADYQSYIDEVVQINQLKDNQIHSGCYLLVPVYHKAVN